MVMLPADRVPVPTTICFITAPVGAAIDTAPLTARLKAPVIVRLVAVAPPAIEMEAAAAAAVTVTALPLAMVTVSAAPGMPPGAPAHPVPPGPHVVCTFHAVLAMEVQAAA